MQHIELMAPAGNFESLQAALDNGADSIYFGVEQLNMRARASINFTLDDLQEISDRCKAKNVRTYLTLNTIIYDHDLTIVKTLVKKAKEIALSKKECELLEIFIANANQVVKREELTKRVWEDNGVIVGRSLDTYISKLRKKLQQDKSIKLTNIHGVGYKLEIL